MFGETPSGIVLLDFILIAMGLFLSPILWGIFKRLGVISTNMTDCIKSLATANNSLAEVLKELHQANIRDTKMDGRIKGIENKIGMISDIQD